MPSACIATLDNLSAVQASIVAARKDQAHCLMLVLWLAAMRRRPVPDGFLGRLFLTNLATTERHIQELKRGYANQETQGKTTAERLKARAVEKMRQLALTSASALLTLSAAAVFSLAAAVARMSTLRDSRDFINRVPLQFGLSELLNIVAVPVLPGAPSAALPH